MTTNATHVLQVTRIDTKSAKFKYDIVNNATGAIEHTRRSDRMYVAAVQWGGKFFGRMDLAIKYHREYPDQPMVVLPEGADDKAFQD